MKSQQIAKLICFHLLMTVQEKVMAIFSVVIAISVWSEFPLNATVLSLSLSKDSHVRLN